MKLCWIPFPTPYAHLCMTLDIQGGCLFSINISATIRMLGDLNKSVVHVEEQCWLNYLRRSLLIQSRNLTWTNYARLSEESYFQPVRENPQWTYFEQNGIIDIHGLGYLGCIIENFAQKFLQKGIRKSLWIMEELLAEKASKFRYTNAEE
ncbi:PRELI domain-containing protein 2-like isoform X3 [Tachypleus tridentatus]|uniref:PRELI domain-containing protein 2-like isoform X3 n=1 Tax=Tachypleus tridentatus TaxID=6853 RepID=UPI003FD2FC6F